MPKKLTQAQAEERVLKRCQEMNYTLLEPFDYINNTTRINIECKNNGHHYIWTPQFYNFISGRNCAKCGGSLKRTQEEAEKQVSEKCIEKNYELIEPFIYINKSDTILKIRCLNDGYKWNSVYHDFCYGDYGCSVCSGSLKRTQEEADKIVNLFCEINNYTLTEPFIYKNNQTKIHLTCNKDNFKWSIYFVNISTNKTKCSRCASSEKPTQELAEEKVLSRCKEMGYVLLKPFVYIDKDKTFLELQCQKDYHIWNVRYHGFVYMKSGCAKCANMLAPTQKEAEEIINNICTDMKYELVENFIYNNNYTKIHLRCKKHKFNWFVTYSSLVNTKTGCPICKTSKGEKKILKLLQKNNIQYVHQKRFKECRRIKPLSFDFYLPDKNTCIEFDGEQHFIAVEKWGGETTLIKQIEKDKIKTDYCLNNNITLIRIMYTENIEEILKNNDIIS